MDCSAEPLRGWPPQGRDKPRQPREATRSKLGKKTKRHGLTPWLAAAFVSLVTVNPTGPAAALEVGDVRQGYVEINGRQVLLPGGEWIVAGTGRNGIVKGVAGAFGTIDSAVLFNIGAGRVQAMVEINTNSISVTEGWGTTKACGEEDALARFNLYRTAIDGLCFFVAKTSVSAATKDGPVAWRAATKLAADRGLSVSETWLTVGYRVSNRYDIIDARFHFDGLSLGALAPGRSDWTKSAVQGDPKKFAVVNGLNAWAGLMAELFESGLHGRLRMRLRGASVPHPLAGSKQEDLNPEIIGRAGKAARKRALDRLVKEEVIVAEDLAAYRAAVEDVAPPPTIEDYYTNLAQKTASFNLFRVSVDYLLAFLVTANPAVSGYITASIVFFHSIAQVLNDMSWDSYIAGQQRDGSELVEFHYIGTPWAPAS